MERAKLQSLFQGPGNTDKTYRSIIRRFLESAQPLTAEGAEAWLASQLTTRRKATIELYRVALTRAFALAGEPVILTTRKHTEKAADPIALTPEEVDALASLTGLSPRDAQYRDVFVFGCITGQRISDLSALTLGKDAAVIVHHGKALLTLTQKKTGARVACPLTPLAEEILERHGGALPSVNCLSRYNSAIRRLCVKAGGSFLEPVVSEGVVRRRADIVSSHTARRTAITHYFARGCDATAICALSGHRSLSVLARYRRMSAEDSALLLAAAL